MHPETFTVRVVPRQAVGVTPAPHGVIPNYINPPTEGWKLTVADWVLMAPCLSFLTLRIFTAVRVQKAWNAADTCMLFAVIISLARCCTNVVWVYKYGEGRHIWDEPEKNFSGIRNYEAIQEMLYTAAIAFVKLSILFLIKKIWEVKRQIYYTCWALIFLVAGYSIAIFFALAFTCTPVYYSWNLPSNPQDYGKISCYDPHKAIVASGYLNIVTDALILVAPIRGILTLKVSWARRFGLMLVFGAGLISFAIAIVRQVLEERDNTTVDSTRSDLESAIYLTIELQFGIICASLPAVRSFWILFAAQTQLGTTLADLLSRISGSRRSSKASDAAERRSSEIQAGGYQQRESHDRESSKQTNSENYELDSIS